MPNPWMPGAIRDPGAAAGYPFGRSRMVWAVHHDTGGTNSYQVCKWGREGYGNSLCNVLYPKVGTPWQFGPIDAVTFHGGSPSDYDHDGDRDDYNPYGPGFEVERLQGEPLTGDQLLWLGRTGLWLESEWGIPNVQYRGPFGGADEPTLFRGHVNHRDLHPNPDGLSPDEWDQITATSSPAPVFGGDMDMYIGQVAQPTSIGPVPVPANTPIALLTAPSGRIISTWAGAGDYGIPAGAAAWRNAGGGRDRVNVIFLDPGQMVGVIAADAATRIVGQPGSSSTPTKVTSTVTSVIG